MKLMFASDIHGSRSACEAMLNAYKAEGAERLILLGDLLYHGPRNNLPDEYDPKGVIALLNGVKTSFSACAATATRRSIRWCSSSRSWQITPSLIWMAARLSLPTAICSTSITCRRTSRATC